MKHPLALISIALLPAVVSASMALHEVRRGSDLERELDYELQVRDKHQAWRDQGLEKVFPIKGEASEFQINFKAKKAGKLKELFGVFAVLCGKGLISPLKGA